jgi:hypothetical protein
MIEEEKNAIDHAQKILRAVKRYDLADLLARQPAAIDKEAEYALVKRGDLVEHSHPQYGGGLFATEDCFVDAPLDKEASKPAAKESPKETMDRLTRQFNQMSELERAVIGDFIKRSAPSVEQDERGALTDEQIGEALLDTLVFKLHANNDQVRRFRDAFHFASACDAMLVDVEEVKQLCRDFSSRTGSVYIKDVESALDGIASRAASTSANVAQGAEAVVTHSPSGASHGQ